MTTNFPTLVQYRKFHFTQHLYQRCAERIFHVSEKDSENWVKYNRAKVIDDIISRITKSVEYIPSEDKKKYYYEKYGRVNFLIYKEKFIFVVKDFTHVVTMYTLEPIQIKVVGKINLQTGKRIY